MFGYHGRYLRIDLSSGAATPVPLPESVLRRFLASAIAKRADPELERAEAAVTAEVTESWGRRFAASFWGGRLLMALTVVGKWPTRHHSPGRHAVQRVALARSA